MDKYKIDSHKLLYHVPRVKDWLDGRLVYPIYAEIAATGQCNQRCTFCALDYMGYENKSQDKDVLLKRLSEMAGLGLKSVMYAGEGEPLIHKQIGDIIVGTKKASIDVAITTNGVNLHKALAEQILGYTQVYRLKGGIINYLSEVIYEDKSGNSRDFFYSVQGTQEC